MYSVRNIICVLLGICLITFQLQSTFAGSWWGSQDPHQPDDKIILENVWKETNPLKKIKYTMLVYARPTVDIMKVTARTIPSFYELDNFDATDYYVKFSTTKQRKMKLIEIVNKLWDEIKFDLVSRKSTLSYTQRVFYFKILNMFSEKISNVNDLSHLKDEVNHEIKNFEVEDVDTPRWDAYTTVANLKNIIDDEDKCKELFSKIRIYGITSTNIDFDMPKSCDEVLKNLSLHYENKFKEKYTYAIHQMLTILFGLREYLGPYYTVKEVVYVDYVTHVKKNNGTFTPVPIESIHISADDKNFLKSLKNGLLLYYGALNEKFWKTIKPEEDANKVMFESIYYAIKPITQENYSETYKLLNSLGETDTGNGLRVKSLIALYESILNEADRKMRLLKLYQSKQQKKKYGVMYYKLLHWLNYWFLSEDSRSRCKLCGDKFEEVIEYIERIQAREAEEIGEMDKKTIGFIETFDNLIDELNYFDRDDLYADTSDTIINPLEDDHNRQSDFANSHNSSPEITQMDHSSSIHDNVSGVSREEVVHEGNVATTGNTSGPESSEVNASLSSPSNVERKEEGSLPAHTGSSLPPKTPPTEESGSSLPLETPPTEESAGTNSSSDSAKGSANSTSLPHEGDDMSDIQPRPSIVESDPVIPPSNVPSQPSPIHSSSSDQGHDSGDGVH